MQVMRISRSKALSWMAVVLLMAATASPALARMTCVMSGNTVLGWGQLEDCCPEQDGSQAAISATCCQFDMARPLNADFTVVEDVTLPLPVAVVVVPWPALVSGPLHAEGTAPGALRGPPAWPGSQCLEVTGVFRI